MLWPFSIIYGGFMALRNLCFDLGACKSERYDIPVLSLGNVTVGGTGKTPHTEYLIKLLAKDYSVAVLSRGYGRKTKGFRAVEADSLPEECGDEPCQIKQKFSSVGVFVCEDRREGIRQIISYDYYDLVLLDDAFQHRWVRPSWSAVLVDYNRPIYDDFVMPSGRLREFASGVKRSDCVLVTKCPAEMNEVQKERIICQVRQKHQPVFFTNFHYGQLKAVFGEEESSLECFSDVLLLTGIANPLPLKQYVVAEGCTVSMLTYSDHYSYNYKSVDLLVEKFEAIDGEQKCILTTEKDAVKLRQLSGVPQMLKNVLFYVSIEVVFLEGKEEFKEIILSHVRKD